MHLFSVKKSLAHTSSGYRNTAQQWAWASNIIHLFFIKKSHAHTGSGYRNTAQQWARALNKMHLFSVKTPVLSIQRSTSFGFLSQQDTHLACITHHAWTDASHIIPRVGQNRIHTLYMTVYLAISLPKTVYAPYIYGSGQPLSSLNLWIHLWLARMDPFWTSQQPISQIKNALNLAPCTLLYAVNLQHIFSVQVYGQLDITVCIKCIIR